MAEYVSQFGILRQRRSVMPAVNAKAADRIQMSLFTW
jgi:hypothetical protein